MTPEQLLEQIEFFASANASYAVAHAAHDPEAAATFAAEAATALHKVRAEIEAIGAEDLSEDLHSAKRCGQPGAHACPGCVIEGLREELNTANTELKATQNARLLSVIFGHHKGAPRPFVLKRRNGRAVVALGAEFPDGAVALRLANDGGWTTSSSGGAEHFRRDDTEIVWLSDELESLAEMERQRDQAVTELAGAKALIAELQAEQRYREALGRGLSDYEAREEGWPTSNVELAIPRAHTREPLAGHCIRCRENSCDGCFYCTEQKPTSKEPPA